MCNFKPVIFPHPFVWKLDGKLKRPIDGPLKSNVSIVRKVLGLNLPIRCLLINGEYAGSCVYPDLCKSLMYIMNLNKDNCPESFKANGVDCTCPFNLKAGDITLEDTIQTYSPVFLDNSWLVVGDYTIRAEISDSRGHFFCLEISFTLGWVYYSA